MQNILAASRMDSWFEMYHINNNNCFSGGICSLSLTLLVVKCGAIVCRMISKCCSVNPAVHAEVRG